ncbi:MAG: hypothetical protein ACI8ZM_005585 [Crocinitomix sp.]|jgi:hypothetical protein
MKIKLITLILIFLSITSCLKEKAEPKPREFYPGMVYFELEGETKLVEASVLLDSLNATRFKLNGFKYTTETTFDSLTYYFNIFDNTPFLKVFDITFDTPTGIATFSSMGFENLTFENVENWQSTLADNEIEEVFDGRKYGYLYCSEGAEQYWIDQLNLFAEVSIADFWYVHEPWCKTGG